ncbi:MAG TPA: hypothetical protein VHX39_23030, partial [Acetobacteraceae bacterium]|nr:hypothetical protein [Acetobacteraceae bacterium]
TQVRARDEGSTLMTERNLTPISNYFIDQHKACLLATRRGHGTAMTTGVGVCRMQTETLS